MLVSFIILFIILHELNIVNKACLFIIICYQDQDVHHCADKWADI